MYAVFALAIFLQTFWTAQGDQCCWCGKRYFEGTPTLPPEAYTGISGVQIAVSADKSFYVPAVDVDPVSLVVLTPSDLENNLTIQLSIDSEGEPRSQELTNPSFKIEGHHGFRVEVPFDVLSPGKYTNLNWTVTQGTKVLRSGSLLIAVAPSIEYVKKVRAVRVVHRSSGYSRFLQRFDVSGPQSFFPFGYFISWPLIAANMSQVNETIGNILHPVSPYDDDLDVVEAALNASGNAGVQWMYDMRHSTADLAAIAQQVNRFKEHPAVFSWYIADEPDGAGSSEGAPVGIDTQVVQEAYNLIRRTDPFHPVSLVLNCKYSAPLYADATDILMIDPYPVSINTSLCTESYGCCGCDGCSGLVTDVSDRMDFTARHIASSKPLHFVGQGFGEYGASGHWTRAPTREEFRVMTYLGFMHNNEAGVSYWLQSDNTYPLLSEAKALAQELDTISTVASASDSVQVSIQSGDGSLIHVAAWCANTRIAIAIANVHADQTALVTLSLSEYPHLDSSATVLFEDSKRVVPIRGGVLVDDVPLPAYGTRVFDLSADCDPRSNDSSEFHLLNVNFK